MADDRVNMQDLPKDAHFIGPDGARYRVTKPASEHERGWVEVWNLSMSAAEVRRMLETPGAVEEGSHPREGFFAFSYPTPVERVE